MTHMCIRRAINANARPRRAVTHASPDRRPRYSLRNIFPLQRGGSALYSTVVSDGEATCFASGAGGRAAWLVSLDGEVTSFIDF